MTPGLGRVTSREAPPPQSEASGGSTWGTRRPPGGPPPEQGLQAPRSCGTQQAAPRNAPDAPVLGRRERSPLFRSREDCASSVSQGPGVVRTGGPRTGGPQREEGPVAPGQKTGHRLREGGETAAEKVLPTHGGARRTQRMAARLGQTGRLLSPGGSFLVLGKTRQ